MPWWGYDWKWKGGLQLDFWEVPQQVKTFTAGLICSAPIRLNDNKCTVAVFLVYIESSACLACDSKNIGIAIRWKRIQSSASYITCTKAHLAPSKCMSSSILFFSHCYQILLVIPTPSSIFIFGTTFFITGRQCQQARALGLLMHWVHGVWSIALLTLYWDQVDKLATPSCSSRRRRGTSVTQASSHSGCLASASQG